MVCLRLHQRPVYPQQDLLLLPPPNLYQPGTSLARLTRGQGLRFRDAVRVWQIPNLDHFLIYFVVAAGSASIHCITASERISPTGSPLQVLSIETVCQPITPFFRMTEITQKSSLPQGFARFASAFAIEISTGPAPEDRDSAHVKSRNVTHNDDFETFIGHRGDISLTEFAHCLKVRFGFPTPKCSIVLIVYSLSNSVPDSPPNGVRSIVAARTAISLPSWT